MFPQPIMIDSWSIMTHNPKPLVSWTKLPLQACEDRGPAAWHHEIIRATNTQEMIGRNFVQMILNEYSC